jgi:hypothetical protein
VRLSIKLRTLIRLRAERCAKEIVAAALADSPTWNEIRGRRLLGLVIDDASWRWVDPGVHPR